MKTILDSKQKAIYVKDVFRRIAPRYDLMNKLMTGGFDLRWKRKVVNQAELSSRQTVLDLGTGTGDLARLMSRQNPELHIVAADFTFEMMIIGRANGSLPFINSDAQELPFTDEAFDCVTSGYLLRNVSDLDQTLGEIFRVQNGAEHYSSMIKTALTMAPRYSQPMEAMKTGLGMHRPPSNQETCW